MDIEKNIALFQELILCGDNIYTWQYDGEGQLLQSNCPNEAIFSAAFTMFGIRDRMLAHAKEHDSPITLGTEFGMIWGAAFEKENGVLRQAFVIGPVFYSDLSIKAIEQGLRAYSDLELSMVWKHRFLDELHTVPAVQNILLSRYLLMLHYCITGTHINVCDLHLPHVSTLDASCQVSSSGTPRRDRQMIYLAERAMLQMVRDGDLNYKEALATSTLLSNGVPVQSPDPLRQGKISIIVFSTLVCRAAMEGGMSPEEAYSLGDYYIQASESAATFDDLAAIPGIMYDDFVRRVHKRRIDPKRSPQVQKCCDFIEMHLNEKIRAEDLAKLVGYSEYYITRKFKAETGFFINDYIKFAKIERAKVLLASSKLSIPEIAEQLGFSTRSYFGQIFKQVVGITPAEFRTSYSS